MQIAYPYIANGIPEIGVPPTDPMNFENLTMWADQDNFKFMLPHLQIRGGRRCRVVEFRLVIRTILLEQIDNANDTIKN